MEALAGHYKWSPTECKKLTIRERREWVAWAIYRIADKEWRRERSSG
jgi:hypothetical protein